MAVFPFPNIVASPSDRNDICGRCGRKLSILTTRTGLKYSICLARNCASKKLCRCEDDIRAGKITDNCSTHWICDCRTGKPCLFHEGHPELIVKRYQAKGHDWAINTGFSLLYERAQELAVQYQEQRKEAFRHCGSCWAKLEKPRAGNKGRCPRGCICHCNDGKACYVHFSCDCLLYKLCQFHKIDRPDVISEFCRALPPNDEQAKSLRKWLGEANIEWYKLKAKQPTKRELAARNRLALPKIGIKGKRLEQKRAASDSKAVVTRDYPKVAQVEISVKPVHAKTAAAKVPRTKFDLALELELKLPDYEKWLAKQRLSLHSTRTYLSRIKGFINVLRESGLDYPPLSAQTKDIPVRDLKQYLKKVAKVKPATLNSYLAAVDNFYGFLGLGKAEVIREELPQEAPQALSARDQKKFLRAVELARRAKDRAIASLLFYTGMRLAECANLELDDVFVIGRKTRAIIRSGKGDRYREVPLNSAVCETMQAWLAERKEKYAGKVVASAVFLNPQGNPMAPNAIYEVIRKIGHDAGLDLSPHTLRHTCLTALIRKQNDVIMVADIAGHKSLNTTRRYSLPTAADKAKALEGLLE